MPAAEVAIGGGGHQVGFVAGDGQHTGVKRRGDCLGGWVSCLREPQLKILHFLNKPFHLLTHPMHKLHILPLINRFLLHIPLDLPDSQILILQMLGNLDILEDLLLVPPGPDLRAQAHLLDPGDVLFEFVDGFVEGFDAGVAELLAEVVDGGGDFAGGGV